MEAHLPIVWSSKPIDKLHQDELPYVLLSSSLESFSQDSSTMCGSCWRVFVSGPVVSGFALNGKMVAV
jgi:hypothetical protein